MNHFLASCISSLRSLDTLHKYLMISIDGAIKNENEMKEMYKFAFKGLELVAPLFELNDGIDINEKIKNINESPLTEDLLFKDVYHELSRGENGITYSIDATLQNRNIYTLTSAVSVQQSFSEMQNVINSSILTNEIVMFETFLSCVLKELVIESPNRYFEGKNISIKDLFEKDIESIKKEEIGRLVECKMFDSIECLREIATKECVSFNNVIKDVYDTFIEIYYRRNLIVHNGGIVNNIYIKNIPEHLSKDIKFGNCLRPKLSYIKKSILVTKLMIFNICYTLISKKGSFFDEEETKLLEYLYSCLVLKQYYFCQETYNVLRNSKLISNGSRTVCYVNYLIAYKHLNKKEDFDNEVEKFDVSGMEEIYKLAKLILQEKYDEANPYIIKEATNPTFKNNVDEWPLFEDYRKTDFYKNLKEPVNLIEESVDSKIN